MLLVVVVVLDNRLLRFVRHDLVQQQRWRRRRRDFGDGLVRVADGLKTASGLEAFLAGQERNERDDDDRGEAAKAQRRREENVAQDGRGAEPASGESPGKGGRQSGVDGFAGFPLGSRAAGRSVDQKEDDGDEEARVEHDEKLIVDGQLTGLVGPGSVQISRADDDLIEDDEEEEEPVEDNVRPDGMLDDAGEEAGGEEDVADARPEEKDPTGRLVERDRRYDGSGREGHEAQEQRHLEPGQETRRPINDSTVTITPMGII